MGVKVRSTTLYYQQILHGDVPCRIFPRSLRDGDKGSKKMFYVFVVAGLLLSILPYYFLWDRMTVLERICLVVFDALGILVLLVYIIFKIVYALLH